MTAARARLVSGRRTPALNAPRLRRESHISLSNDRRHQVIETCRQCTWRHSLGIILLLVLIYRESYHTGYFDLRVGKTVASAQHQAVKNEIRLAVGSASRIRRQQRRYKNASLFDPRIVAGRVLPFGHFRFTKQYEFNPAIVPIREWGEYRDSITRAYPRAVYVQATRGDHPQCKVPLEEYDAGVLKATQDRYNDPRGEKYTRFHLLDSNYNEIQRIDTNLADPHNPRTNKCRDLRLHAIHGKVVATCMGWKSRTWYIWELRLLLADRQQHGVSAGSATVSNSSPTGGVSAISLEFVKPSNPTLAASSRIQGHGRNRIIFTPPGSKRRPNDAPVYFIDSVGDFVDTVSERKMNVSTDLHHPVKRRSKRQEMHLNGIAIHLPARRAYLAITHRHFDKLRISDRPWDARPHPQDGDDTFVIPFHTPYGNTYMHYFILFEDREPWRITKASGAWCFPSLDNATRCDAIQYVGSALKEGQTLTVTYGVNDCDSAMAQLSMSDVLSTLKSLKQFEKGEETGEGSSTNRNNRNNNNKRVNPFEDIKVVPHDHVLPSADGKGNEHKAMLDPDVVFRNTTKCVVYGIGIDRHYGFEMNMSQWCETHAFDCTMEDSFNTRPPVHFHNFCVGTRPKFAQMQIASKYFRRAAYKIGSVESLKYNSWANTLKLLGHERVDVLKMDIEGGEWEVLANVLRSPRSKLPRQIMFELHTEGANKKWVPPALVRGKRKAEVDRLFDSLQDAGYMVGSKEINQGDHLCAEFLVILK